MTHEMHQPSRQGRYRLTARGERLLLNDEPFTAVGLRCSNALISDGTTGELVANLPAFAGYGVNTVSVFFMGSRFGDVRGFRPDASLDPIYAERMGRIIDAADALGMVVLVGCLYWCTSRAKAALEGSWGQREANAAIAGVARWLRRHDYRNVFVDIDNEGMAQRATGWDPARMIDAGHGIDDRLLMAYNSAIMPAPANADLHIHHAPRAPGKPWVESEGSSPGYWGEYSRDPGEYYNYLRIGRYTPAMKERIREETVRAIEHASGYLLASTYLQCPPSEGIGGPFMRPGGLAENPAVDAEVKALQEGSGIRWWLEFVRDRYGAWSPPPVNDDGHSPA